MVVVGDRFKSKQKYPVQIQDGADCEFVSLLPQKKPMLFIRTL
jgi:hypothetical protein